MKNHKLVVDIVTKDRIYRLHCDDCAAHTPGNEVRFSERETLKHGGDTALKAELDALYSHKCADHS